MADVQLEHGYTKIANELLERMALTKLSPIQYRIIFVIWRFTYGFNRKEHALSSGFLSKATEYDERQIRRELQRLERRKIILQIVSPGRSRTISFNKNYDEWLNEETPGNSTLGKTPLRTSGKVTLGTPGNSTPQEINKEINKEEEEESLNNHDAFQKIADKFIQRRARGLVLSKKDEESINRLLEDDIPLDKILFLIDTVFDEYKSKHRLDYIAKFEYVEKGVLDRYHNEKKKRSNLDVLDEIASKYETE
ncbi:replication protein [Priestia abyssalis]|uniref:replication protein n=1 Tax=Priestia abyssalis TaxID=1221450 RepID=UPI0014751452|nr:replication protein [Priestia abyssalis]